MKKYEIHDVEVSTMEEAAISYNLGKDDMAHILGVSEKTYYNMLKKTHLDFDRSDRFHLLQQIFDSGEEALGSAQSLSQWLKSTQPSLGGFQPLDMMRSINGAHQVLQALGRIKHGITA